MNRKDRAARAVNFALGMIVILAVVASSPLFGYARGFTTPEQRAASAEAEAETEVVLIRPAAATPRPTPKPTPTPVILPSAPPTPEPTEPPVYQPVHTPAPQAQQYTAPVQQQAWTPEEIPEEEYEEDWEEDEALPGTDSGIWSDTGGTAAENDIGGQYIPNDNFDLIFADQGSVSTAQTVEDQAPPAENYGYTESGFQQDEREGKVLFIE